MKNSRLFRKRRQRNNIINIFNLKMILPLLARFSSQTGGYSKNATGMFCRQSVVSSGLMQL